MESWSYWVWVSLASWLCILWWADIIPFWFFGRGLAANSKKETVPVFVRMCLAMKHSKREPALGSNLVFCKECKKSQAIEPDCIHLQRLMGCSEWKIFLFPKPLSPAEVFRAKFRKLMTEEWKHSQWYQFLLSTDDPQESSPESSKHSEACEENPTLWD